MIQYTSFFANTNFAPDIVNIYNAIFINLFMPKDIKHSPLHKHLQVDFVSFNIFNTCKTFFDNKNMKHNFSPHELNINVLFWLQRSHCIAFIVLSEWMKHVPVFIKLRTTTWGEQKDALDHMRQE